MAVGRTGHRADHHTGRREHLLRDGRPQYLGIGGLCRAPPVPGVTVDLPTGALLVRSGLPSFNYRRKHEIAWYYNSQDGTGGPGNGSSSNAEGSSGPAD